MGVIDRIILEFGGATAQTVDQISSILLNGIILFLQTYAHCSEEEIIERRYNRFRKF